MTPNTERCALMTRYRKKPVEVEAWQVGSDETKPDWVMCGKFDKKKGLPIAFEECGVIYVKESTWIVRKDNEMVQLLTDKGFRQTYEVVE